MCNRAVGVFILFTASTLIGSVSAREDPPKKQTDEEISKLLVGKWIVDEGDGKTEPKIKGSMNYKKDGTVDAEATIEAGQTTLKITLSGTWKVKDGVLIATVTKTSAPDVIKEGLVSKDTVISIDDKVLKYKEMSGKEKSQKRMKE
jgi:hypothetical protein